MTPRPGIWKVPSCWSWMRALLNRKPTRFSWSRILAGPTAPCTFSAGSGCECGVEAGLRALVARCTTEPWTQTSQSSCAVFSRKAGLRQDLSGASSSERKWSRAPAPGQELRMSIFRVRNFACDTGNRFLHQDHTTVVVTDFYTESRPNDVTSSFAPNEQSLMLHFTQNIQVRQQWRWACNLRFCATHNMGGLATLFTNHQQHTNTMSTANHSVSKYRNQLQNLKKTIL